MYSVVDIETTGGKSSTNRITEIAIVKTDGKQIIEQFSSLVNPTRSIDKFVAKLTGITDEMVADAPLFEDLIEKINQLTKDTIFVAHNVGFDYSILKKEYRRVGKVFRKNTLCTVKLSRKTLKNQNSYSLGSLAENLGITIKNRHRALGDAEATAHLLHHIIQQESEDVVLNETAYQTQQIEFKGEITNDIIEELPEEPGTFRFLNREGKILYVGFAKNIFAEVTKFLTKEIKQTTYFGLFENMFSIDFEMFNSYFMAQLYAIAEIQKYKPIHNKANLYKQLNIGVFEQKNQLQQGAFSIENIKKENTQNALWYFANKSSAKRFLTKLNKKIKVPTFKGNQEQFDQQYQQGIEKILKEELYPMRNFFIIREVSFENKAYLVWVEDFIYKGYGVIDLEKFKPEVALLKQHIRPQRNTSQAQKLIKRYINKAKGIHLINY